MANTYGPLDVVCDAPAYPIVRASRAIGLNRPEDVRWCRFSNLGSGLSNWRDILNFQTWKTFLAPAQQAELNCSCGHKMPDMERYTFTFVNGTTSDYLLGQCDHCRTVYWEES